MTVYERETYLPKNAHSQQRDLARLSPGMFHTIERVISDFLSRPFFDQMHRGRAELLAGIFGYFLLGERLGSLSILGCFLILAGMVISELRISGRDDSDS